MAGAVLAPLRRFRAEPDSAANKQGRRPGSSVAQGAGPEGQALGKPPAEAIEPSAWSPVHTGLLAMVPGPKGREKVAGGE